MNKRDARQSGIEHGLQAIEFCEVGNTDRLGSDCECKPPKVCRECLKTAAFNAHFESFRQSDTFSFLASEINDQPEDRVAGLWNAYDEGVSAGIRKGLTARLKAEREKARNERENAKQLKKYAEYCGKLGAAYPELSPDSFSVWFAAFGNAHDQQPPAPSTEGAK